MNGADLMLPGVDVSSGLPPFAKGDLLAVCVKGNPVSTETLSVKLANISHCSATFPCVDE